MWRPYHLVLITGTAALATDPTSAPITVIAVVATATAAAATAAAASAAAVKTPNTWRQSGECYAMD